MNKHSSLKPNGSLLERAADVYDFNSAIRAPVLPPRDRPRPSVPEPGPVEEMEAETELRPRKRRNKTPIILSEPVEEAAELEPIFAEAAPFETFAQPALVQPSDDFLDLDTPAPFEETAAPLPSGRRGQVAREALEEAGFILPDGPVTSLAEEFRIIKRQLLLGVDGSTGIPPHKRQSILICSAHADEGKTFSAVNLALSLASEKDLEVLLVDGDFVKPEILSILGLEGGPGLIDAIADSSVQAEDFVIRTDLGGLSVLPAGRAENNVTEMLASERTREVLNGLVRGRPNRVVIFDSPPALMASPASVLATHVGQVMMVVRADQTTEADLKEAVGLLSGCDNVSLMLNGAGFAATSRRFGSYYGYGQ